MTESSMQILKGVAVSPGVAMAKAFVLGRENLIVPKRKINPEQIPLEIARFEEALTKTRQEIRQIQKRIDHELGHEHGDIFNAHLLVLEDRTMIEEVIELLNKERWNLEFIFNGVLQKYVRVFSNVDDAYIKERTADVQDVGRRILQNLMGQRDFTLLDLEEPSVVVADDLSPSDTALMRKERVVGFVTMIGSRTSHTAIMARSLEIPAVVGVEDVDLKVKTGDFVVLDGHDGQVVISPDEATIQQYRARQEAFQIFVRKLDDFLELPPVTRDGKRVSLMANIEMPEEVTGVLARGAEGVGLYRTEYFYMNREGLPSEEQHYQAYKAVASQMAPRPVTIRTLDLGGDKFVSHLDVPRELNPFLGWRAIRFCLARPDIFKVQMRAILRASAHGKIRMMYPLITGVEEMTQANAMLEEIKNELRHEKIAFDESMEVGAMIETPAAAVIADILAPMAGFFSIGTNDLIQYSLAVDRVNEKIAYLYEPAHPAVLRLIKQVIDAGHRVGIPVAMCGEMAGDLQLTVIMIGLGLDEFSTNAMILPQLKRIIRATSLSDAEKLSWRALQMTSGEQIRGMVQAYLKDQGLLV